MKNLLVAIALLAMLPAQGSALTQSERIEIETGEGVAVFQVELAITPAQLQRGLMERRYLPPNAGMMFRFSPPRRASMWMKNTWISLDMLFIDSKGVIRFIAPMTTPHSLNLISSPMPVSSVLEIAGGRAEELGIKVGDRVLHKWFEPAE